MEYVEPVISVATCFVTPVWKYWQYHTKLNDYIRKLKTIIEELNGRMEDIELQLKEELRHSTGKVPKTGVQNWLENAKATISKAKDVENNVSNGRYLCRAWNGKLVDEKTREMQKFLDKAPNTLEGLVIDGPSAGLPLPTSELVGEKAARDEIWEYLIHEEVSKIGAWGLGGVGKTTIIKHIHNDLLNQQQGFERVIWVTVSQEFNVVKLQEDIASELNGELPKGDKLRRAKILSEMLTKAGKHVLILDDVWDKVTLEEVGIPEPSRTNGCKLVLTTRIEQVCKYMGCKVVVVKPLSEEDALILFSNKVGPNISPALKPTLKLVVRECAGLPLTIVAVAGTLKGDNDPCIWKNAHKELKESIRKVEGVEAEVIERLKSSYNHLKDVKVKHCFLYCALYPKDFEIWKDELIECWIDEGLIDEMDTREDMKDKGYAILKKLEGNCLLENVIGLRRHAVKLHDAVRDMALSITSMKPRYMIRAGLKSKTLPKVEEWMADVEKVSLMKNYGSEIPMGVSSPKCELLTTLLLQENFIRIIPDSFFDNMPSLGVLNLSGTRIERLPDSFSKLENLTALLLCGCRGLRRLPNLSKLQGLKKLDLHFTGIEEVPEGMDMLIDLRYCDLRVTGTLKGISVGVLSRLQYLRFDLVNEKTSLKAEEVVGLEKLEWFEGRFKDMHEFNTFVSSSMLQRQSMKNLIKYRLQVGSTSSKVYFTFFKEKKSVYHRRGKIVSINQVKFSEGELIMLPTDAQELNMHECSGIKYVASSSSTLPFQSLEVLRLYYLPDLSEVILKAEGLATSSSFSHLQRIDIRGCHSMKTLLPHWLFPNLQNLQEIWVKNCDELVEIFGAAPTLEGKEKSTSDAFIEINLPKLRELRLWILPKLESVCSKSGAMVCDSLKLFYVIDCKNLKRIPPFVPLVGDGQRYAYAPPSLKISSGKEWWESLEWDDHENFKKILQPIALNSAQYATYQTNRIGFQPNRNAISAVTAHDGHNYTVSAATATDPFGSDDDKAASIAS